RKKRGDSVRPYDGGLCCSLELKKEDAGNEASFSNLSLHSPTFEVPTPNPLKFSGRRCKDCLGSSPLHYCLISKLVALGPAIQELRGVVLANTHAVDLGIINQEIKALDERVEFRFGFFAEERRTAVVDVETQLVAASPVFKVWRIGGDGIGVFEH